MVVPRRIADPHCCVRVCAENELSGYAERTGTARRLDGGDSASIFSRICEQQPFNRVAEDDVAPGAEICLAVLAANKPVLGFFDCPQYWRIAGCIAIDADAKVDFLRTGIILMLRNQFQDGICRFRLK